MNYVDPDWAYFLGMVIARGTLSESAGLRQITINLPHSSLEVRGISVRVDQQTSIKLGLGAIRRRLGDLLDTEIEEIETERAIDLVVRFSHNAIPWRMLIQVTNGQRSFRSFQVPAVFLDSNTPEDLKREFIRGFADVAGNIRYANRYVDGRNRVRLDVLNYLQNWRVPVDLCQILQDGIKVPVQNITWGHPNMKRGLREHQINIFAIPFLQIGFSFEHKQKVLEELAAADRSVNSDYYECPGRRQVRASKESDPQENSAKLPAELRGQHFDSYWQICKALGCPREPYADQLPLPLDSEE
jgi:hypothetical protein